MKYPLYLDVELNRWEGGHILSDQSRTDIDLQTEPHWRGSTVGVGMVVQHDQVEEPSVLGCESQDCERGYSLDNTMDFSSSLLWFSFYQCTFCGKMFHIYCMTVPDPWGE